MPPKLTSKNVFDVVFEQLPADAFIDTGPASLREELMLEAAGMSGSNSGSSNASEHTNSRGGSSHFRRHLLPSSWTAAATGTDTLRSLGRSKKASTSAVPATTSFAGGAAIENDVLGDGEGEAMLAGGGDASAPPPAYTSSTSPNNNNARASGSTGGSSLFRRADDSDGDSVEERMRKGRLNVKELNRGGARSRGVGIHSGSDTIGGEEDTITEGEDFDFAMQMDEDDEAVKEATKYAKLVAAMRKEAEKPEGEEKEENNNEVSRVDDAGRLKDFHSGNNAGVVPSAQDHGALVASGSTDGAAAAVSAAVAGKYGPQGGSAMNASTLSPTVNENGGPTNALTEDRGSGSPSAQFPTIAAAMTRSGPLTAEEQLALMPPGLDRVYTGACVMYRHPKGFGFISPDLGGPDVYFINDSITLSFTRLALRAFYLKHGMPLPPSVATIFHEAHSNAGREDKMDMKEAGEAKQVDEVTSKDAQATAEDSETARSVEEGHPNGPSADGGTNTDKNRNNKTMLAGGKTEETTTAAPAETNISDSVLGDAAAMPHMEGTSALPSTIEHIGYHVSIPPTTTDELAVAEAAAALLTTATARLLQHQVDQGFGGGVRVGERMSFVATRNHAGRGGNGRLLRAEFIRGVPSAHFALPVEQSWFAPMFPGAVGRKASFYGAQNFMYGGGAGRGLEEETASSTQATTSNSGGGAAGGNTEVKLVTSAGAGAATLVRYTGCVRTYNAEDQRGYLRCDEIDGSGSSPPDVVFHAHSFLWDIARCPPLKRQVKESVRVAYSVCGTERKGKYIATLITTPEGEPFCEENMTFAENVRPFYMPDGNRRRGRGDDNSSGGGLGGGRTMNSAECGMGGGGDGGGGGDRKRAKVAEEDLLLFEDADYPLM